MLKNKGKYQFTIAQLDRYMRNIGDQQFNYESFKAVYDTDPKIQRIVQDFDQETITLKSNEVDDLAGGAEAGANHISTMAKRATNLGN